MAILLTELLPKSESSFPDNDQLLVMKGIMDGYSLSDIASGIAIRPKDAKMMLATGMQKAKVNNLYELIVWGLRTGVIKDEPLTHLKDKIQPAAGTYESHPTWIRVLEAIISGYSDQDIDREAGISRDSLEYYKKMISDKFNLGNSRAKLIRFGFQLLNPIEGPPQVKGFRIPVLSLQQQEILKLICQGYNTKEMADMLQPPISPKTVEYHRAMIKAKLGIDTHANVATTEITRMALKYFPDLLTDRPQASKMEAVGDIFHSLTPQQLTVFKMYVRGYSTKEIADFLKVSHKTVEFHRNNLFHRLGINNPADVTALAVKLGIIEPSLHPGKVER
jgi:DNA-binding CsgD family transcriptional regulator